MKTKLLFLFFLCLFSAAAQHLSLDYYDDKYVFSNGATTYGSPSLKAKVIGTLNEHAFVEVCHNWDFIHESKPGWVAILYNNAPAYIQRKLLADRLFRSDLDPDLEFMLRISPQRELEFKVFRHDSLISRGTLKLKKHGPLIGMGSLGKTYNSGNKEVLAVIYEGKRYELFGWDGKTLSASAIRLSDDSFVNGEAPHCDLGIINASLVQLRSAPGLTASVIGTLAQNTRVQVTQMRVKEDVVGGRYAVWHKLHWKGRDAYVWDDYIDAPVHYMKSNRKEDEAFFLTTHALYTLQNGQVTSRLKTPYVWAKEKANLVDFGKRGLDERYRLIGIHYRAYACGEYGGDAIYTWNGQQLKYLVSSGGIGDGGLSETDAVIFPSDPGGERDHVIGYRLSTEMDDTEGPCRSQLSAVKLAGTFLLDFKGDTLVEAPSAHSRLRAFVRTGFPGYALMHYTFGDLNGDSLNDAVFLLNKVVYEEEPRSKPLVVIAAGQPDGTFGAARTNNALVAPEYFAVQFALTKEALEVTVKYNLGYAARQDQVARYNAFSFVYDKAAGEFLWHSQTTASDISSSAGRVSWGNFDTRYFKTKKISFEKAWRGPAYE